MTSYEIHTLDAYVVSQPARTKNLEVTLVGMSFFCAQKWVPN